MNLLLTVREKFRQQWCWILFPVLFAICFIVPNRTGATNLYRLLIVVPMLLCFRPADLKDIWANTPARWFLLLCGWMSLTLFWDGWSDKDIKLLLRELNVLALFYLAYLVCTYQGERMSQIIDWFLVFGFIGALLIILDWRGIEQIQANWQHKESGRGIFNHHLEVGWIMATLSIVSLCQWIRSERVLLSILYLMIFVFFIGLTFLIQARGGYVVAITGSIFILLANPGKKRNYLICSGFLLSIVMVLILYHELLILLEKVVDRGTSMRLPIWQNAIVAISESSYSLLFGQGLTADSSNMVGKFQAAHYHNFFLNQTFYTGLIGFGLFFSVLFSALKIAFFRGNFQPWGVVLFSMQMGFLTDGDRLFVNPSSTLLCFLLPLMFISFSREVKRPVV